MIARRSARFLAPLGALMGVLTAPAAPLASAAAHCPEGAPVADTAVCRVTKPYREPVAGQGEERTNLHSLDIYYDPSRPNADVVVFVHGGAWSEDDKSNYEDLGLSLALHHGLATVAVNYELSVRDKRSGPSRSPKHPAHVKDVAEAFAWVKRNIAAYGGNAERVFLAGHSAGAHLASLTATQADWLQGVAAGCSPTGTPCTTADIRGVVSMSGLYDLPSMARAGERVGLDGVQAWALARQFRLLLEDVFGPDEATWADASPIAHVGAGQPPFLLVYTYDDLPGLGEGAHDFSVAIRGQLGEETSGQTGEGAQLALRRVERIDYSADVWGAAACLASGGTLEDDQTCTRSDRVAPTVILTGHYAEIIALNPAEPENYPTRLLVDFVASH
jgi:acetyl esterase/lipase